MTKQICKHRFTFNTSSIVITNLLNSKTMN
nr:MAG TPA: hypothetical protein [Crassvirales sp.]